MRHIDHDVLGTVPGLGLGCMGMSWGYGTLPSRARYRSSRACLAEAVERGVRIFDTADAYGDGTNELLLGATLGGVSDALLATKVGYVVEDTRRHAVRLDCTPERIARAAEQSLRRLHRDVIDLYYLHAVDPLVPLEDSWGAMSELVHAGKVRALGLCNVTVAQAASAHAVHPVGAVQNELSIWQQSALAEESSFGVSMVDWCSKAEALFVAYSPLGRGGLIGAVTKEELSKHDIRIGRRGFDGIPRPNLATALAEIVGRTGCTPAQIALSWIYAVAAQAVPIPGTIRADHLVENLRAADVRLDPQEVALLSAAAESDEPTQVARTSGAS